MSGKNLDFFVFGPARSGTTAFTHLLSSVEQVHCSHEVFGFNYNHKNIRLPEEYFLDRKAFMRKSGETRSLRRTVKDTRLAIEEKGDSILLYGNKLPAYFLKINSLFAETGARAAIATYRNVGSIARSFTARADLAEDSWPSGRTGIFAAGECLLFAKALSNSMNENILIIPQPALLMEPRAAIDSAMAFLDSELEYSINEKNFDDASTVRSKQKKDTILSDWEADAVSECKAMGIDEAFDVGKPVSISEMRETVEKLLQNFPEDINAFVESRVEKYGNDEQKKYLQMWKRRNRKADFTI